MHHRLLIALVGVLTTAAAAPLAAQVTVGPFDLPAGAEVTIEIDVMVTDPVASPASDWSVCSQGSVSDGGLISVPSDDPGTGELDDPTCTALADFGDAPTSFAYPQDAVHAISPSGLRLGAAIDADSGPRGTAVSADGDDTTGVDDDDGVAFGLIRQNQVVAVDVVASAPCILNAWIDWAANGNWTDAADQIFVDQALAAGNNALNFPAPATIFIGTTYARFRCSSAGGLGAGGAATDGEVEDYEITTLVPVELQSFEVE